MSEEVIPGNVPAIATDDQPSEQTIEEIVASLGDTVGETRVDDPKMTVSNVDVHYADKQAIFGVDLDIANNEVISMIGPSGCGKSTLLRCLNRMNDTIPICRVTGELKLDGEDIYGKDLSLIHI